ncbi:sensor histidine kinase [Kitasatospora sp. NPDC059795]|uniref:sensor histidine kinase n=1 Tax=Kitasatospora sp. NPDC059795 TaxID=3346949 RepID=UPI00364E74AC
MSPHRHGRGPTIRTRLALLNTAVLAAGGAALLAINWFLVREALSDHSATVVAPSATTELAPAATAPAAPAPSGSPFESAAASAASPAHQFEEFRDAVLHDLLTRSALALFAVLALALLAGWWVARRSLSRIGAVTAAARHINDTNLHDRLALVGPDDEVSELADTFDAMLDRLEKSFAEQRRFTAQASHELRTPLTLQRTALEIPLAQGLVPDNLRPAIHRALDAVDRSENLIGSLLALARGESGILTPRPTDLADLARTAIADTRAEADNAAITVETRLGPAPVTGDPSLLTQLVHNLVANAVRHNHPGGTVHLSTGHSAGQAYIEVTNSGPAIDEADIPSLLEPFRRGRTGGHGAGLGLSVIRAVVTTHQGTLTITPNPAGGLTTHVLLPTAREDAEQGTRRVVTGY